MTSVYLHLVAFNEIENGLKNLHSTQIQLHLEQETFRLGLQEDPLDEKEAEV